MQTPALAKRKPEEERMHADDDQWLGEGYYFWQDYEFAKQWGPSHVCLVKGVTQYEVYVAELAINWESDNDVLDVVFNEKNYLEFVKIIEDFAARFHSKYRAKPSLSDFNDFAQDNNIWSHLRAIRFNDNPDKFKRDYLKMTGLPYKKRIQIVVFDLTETLRTFVRENVYPCR